jgi:hypothetical protein
MVKVLRGSWSILDSFSSMTQLYICPMEYWNVPASEGQRDAIRWRGFIDHSGGTNFSHTYYGDTRRGDRNQNW